MNRILNTLVFPLVFLVMHPAAGADTPKKQPIGRYSSLWSKSPFTTPPVKEEGEAPPGRLDDYVLTGVSKLPSGYFVSLMNKKKRDDRIMIMPGEANPEGFKVLSVVQDQDPIKFKETIVRISVDGETGAVGYDEKFLVLKKAAVVAKKPVKPGAPHSGRHRTPTPKPKIPGLTNKKPPTPPSGGSSRSPRVRRVTPPKR